VQRPSCSTADLVSEGAPASAAPAVFLTVLAGGGAGFADDGGSSERAESVRSGTLETSTVRRVLIVVGIRSAEERYRNVCRNSAGVMPVARRNARVKLDCEENRQSRAISPSDARPVAIIALALSSRRWLT
jgi:hypothetical protein